MKYVVIQFGEEVELTTEETMVLVGIADRACKRWEKANPGHVMWPSAYGSPLLNMYTAGEDEPLRFKDDTFQIECTSRPKFEGET